MFKGSLRSSLAGSRAGEDDEDDDEEALMLGERVGGVQGSMLCSDGTLGASLSPSFSSLPPSLDKGSFDGDSEELRDSAGVEVVEATAASLLARRGVRRTLLLSEDMALRLALRPLSPRPCLRGKQRKKREICDTLDGHLQQILSSGKGMFPQATKIWLLFRSCLCPKIKPFIRPVVVQHDTVWRLIIAQADVVIQLGQLLTQRHQLILSCSQRPLALIGC